MKISNTKLNLRTKYNLITNGIINTEQIRNWDNEEILSLRNIGVKQLTEIKKELENA